MRVLTRTWQMLLKALEEVANAPNAMMAAEMAVIRLTHVADLPTPDELIKKLKDTPAPPPTQARMTPTIGTDGPRGSTPVGGPSMSTAMPSSTTAGGSTDVRGAGTNTALALSSALPCSDFPALIMC